MKSSEQTGAKQEDKKLVEGVDYYFENGLMVLTEHFLLKRRYCCDKGCRHCPYREPQKHDLQ